MMFISGLIGIGLLVLAYTLTDSCGADEGVGCIAILGIIFLGSALVF
jgi:hypothetical protein